MIVRRHLLTACISLIVLVCLWAPLVVVAINSVNKDILLASWEGFTFHWFTDAFHDEPVRSGLRSTMTIAALSSLLSLALAVSSALWWRKASPRARHVFDLFTYLRLILPEVVFALALFLLFRKIDFPLGTLAVVIGHTVWNSAYATLIIQARLAALDPALEDAAADLGATPWRVFRRVTVPGLLPAVVAAGLLAFTFSFDDVVTSLFLSGSATAPLPVVLLGKIRFRVDPEINAIGMMVMGFTIVTFALAYLVLSRLGRRQRGTIGIAAGVRE